MGWDYLAFRFWIGFWMSCALMLMVAFDLSSLVRFITRFTEESFAMLIAIIFIFEAFAKMYEILSEFPVDRRDPNITVYYNCSCFPKFLNQGLKKFKFLFIIVTKIKFY